MERSKILEHRLYTLMGILALDQPFSKSDEELHSAGLWHISVHGPEIELPESFGAQLRRLMESYQAVGLRPS